jgi:hypothetical protein
MQAKFKVFYAIWRSSRRTGLCAEGTAKRRIPSSQGRSGEDRGLRKNKLVSYFCASPNASGANKTRRAP